MSTFTSSREKYYWLCTALVVIAIFSTLFLGRPLAEALQDQNMQSLLFLVGMFLVGVMILVHSLQTKPNRIEIALLLGIAAIYILLFLRLGLPERSHLIEYSVLAVIMHKAIQERKTNGKKISYPALWALLFSFIIGLIDEGIQIFLPDRVFDYWDIVFNGIAVSLAMGAVVVIAWVRKLIKNSKEGNS